MKKTILLSFVVIFAVIFPVAGQDEKLFDEKLGADLQSGMEAPYILSGRFIDHTFVGVGFGMGLHFSRFDSGASFPKRIRTAWEVSVGKWVSPTVGLRLQFVRTSAEGMTGSNGGFAYGNAGSGGLYKEHFKLVNIHGDLLFDIRNAIEGYHPYRLWSYVPFIGFGIAHSFMNGANTDEFAASLGLLNIINISSFSKAVDFTLEGRYMLAKDDRSLVSTREALRHQLTVTVGVRYKFGSKIFKRPVFRIR
jgi:hypothetical protein